MTPELYYRDLLGKPYRIGARGTKEFDCYGVVLEILRRLEREVSSASEIAYQSAEEGWSQLPEWLGASGWEKVGDSARDATELGDVLYSVPRPTIHHVHVVVWNALPRIALHANKAHGVHAVATSRIPDIAGVFRYRSKVPA